METPYGSHPKGLRTINKGGRDDWGGGGGREKDRGKWREGGRDI